MLYQPSYPYPYLSDIDATDNNTFYAYINTEGGTTVNAYNLTINDLSGQQIYTTNKQTISTPLYSQQVLYINVPSSSGMINGRDYVWNVQLYESNADIWVAFGTVQEGENTTTKLYLRKNYLVSSGDYIVINSQKVKMTSYSSETGIAELATPLSAIPTQGTTYNIYSDNVKSVDYLFYARSAPQLQIDYLPEPELIRAKSYTFTATYTQAQGVNYKYFIWTLYDELGNVIDTTGEITTGTIAYTFDGFINGNTYGVSVELETQDGTKISTDIESFTVKYEPPDVSISPKVEVDCNKDAIKISWASLLINDGEYTSGGSGIDLVYYENEPYEGAYSVWLPTRGEINWDIGSKADPLYIDPNSTTYINWSPTSELSASGRIIYSQEVVPLELSYIGAIPPSRCTIGERYYNTVTGLIYVATNTNIWGAEGELPDARVLYSLKDSETQYMYNGVSMIKVPFDTTNLGYSVLYYGNGKFMYYIDNGEINRKGIVSVYQRTDNKFLLQPQDVVPVVTEEYMWQDDEVWNDNFVWTESVEWQTANYWYKITLLPTEIQVKALEKRN